MGVKLVQPRNENSGIAATVGMMPPHEFTAVHVLAVIHPRVTFPESSAPGPPIASPITSRMYGSSNST